MNTITFTLFCKVLYLQKISFILGNMEIDIKRGFVSQMIRAISRYIAFS